MTTVRAKNLVCRPKRHRAADGGRLLLDGHERALPGGHLGVSAAYVAEWPPPFCARDDVASEFLARNQQQRQKTQAGYEAARSCASHDMKATYSDAR